MNSIKALILATLWLPLFFKAAGAIPSNDAFANPSELSGTTVSDTATNMGASTDVGEPATSGYKTLWWSYRPAVNGRLTITTTGSDGFNKVLAVYLGTVLPNVRLVATANEGVCCSIPLAVVEDLPVVANTEYRISVGSSSSTSVGGHVVLALSLDTEADIHALNTPVPATTANDFFANRVVLSGETVGGVGYNLSASNEASAAEPVDSGNRTLWWTYRAPANGRLTITTSGSDGFDKNLAVYLGTNLPNLRLVASFSENCCNGVAAILNLPVTANTDYQVSVGSVAVNSGGAVVLAFSLNTQSELSNLSLAAPASAANDNFANRVTLVGNTVSAIGYNVAATREPLEPTDPSTQLHSLWWTWTAPAAGQTQIDLTGSDAGDKSVTVWRGAVLHQLVSVAASPTAARPSVKFNASAGESYQIAVGNPTSKSGGSIVLSIAGAVAEFGSSLPNIAIERAIHLRWFATLGARYQVQNSADERTWTNVGGLITGDGNFRDFYEATTQGASFYRIFLQP